MSPKPEDDPLRAIDRETFEALRKDPAKLEAHLDGILAAVHARMTQPFQKTPPLSYQVFPKKPVLDPSTLVRMPGVVVKPESEPVVTTAPSPPPSPAPPPDAPAKAHPPTPKPPEPLRPQGTFVDQAEVSPPRGVWHDALPELQTEAPLSATMPTGVAEKSVPAATPVMPEKPVVAEVAGPKQADAEAVKKRFEQRQGAIESLLKDKGRLT